ncbi:hypothetical protein GOBAR_AA09095 [Gossypium barbadense]|uniref:Uncharacterized protein n=1 Tax=Gossypium barbadense TaxID=3634 RepID=A0A2P5Y7J8_GOSBA|nr:hypothetical protein GOBAR_AA09095 [Gossypium barbadense]
MVSDALSHPRHQGPMLPMLSKTPARSSTKVSMLPDAFAQPRAYVVSGVRGYHTTEGPRMPRWMGRRLLFQKERDWDDIQILALGLGRDLLHRVQVADAGQSSRTLEAPRLPYDQRPKVQEVLVTKGERPPDVHRSIVGNAR